MGSELIYRGHEPQPQDSAGGYSPKPPKRCGWLSRPLRYLLGEQRLLCVLVGVALASLVFVLLPRAPPAAGSAVGAHVMVDLVRRRRRRRRRRVLQPPGGAPGEEVRRGEGAAGAEVEGAEDRGERRGGVRRKPSRGPSACSRGQRDHGGYFFTGKKENVMHHFGNPNFEIIRHDVVEPLLLEVDQIYHLACPASPVHYKFNPIKTIISFSIDDFSSSSFENFFFSLTDWSSDLAPFLLRGQPLPPPAC